MNFLKRLFIKNKKQLIYHRNSKMLRFPLIMHPLFDVPLLQIESLKKDTFLEDAALDRICTAFLKAETHKGAEDIWTELAEDNLNFIQCLKNKDFTALRQIFSNLFHGTLLSGMGHNDIFTSRKCPHDRNYLSYCIRDNILSLAEALSVKNVLSSQQTPLTEYIKSTNCDLEPYIDKIERVTGHSIAAPDVGKPPVAIIGRYAISPDSVSHAYIMHRVKQLGFNEHSHILEIGGGFGNVARYAYLQGFRSYTMIDLPYVAAIQAAFLFATIGADKVSLLGEVMEAPIKIFPSTHKNSIQANFDLVINIDSLTQINIDEVIDYLKIARARAKYFLSVNQEAHKTHKGRIPQHIVSEVTGKVGGFKLLHRNIYWMKQGYVEELYQSKIPRLASRLE